MDEWVGPAYLHHLFPYEVTGNDEEGSAGMSLPAAASENFIHTG